MMGDLDVLLISTSEELTGRHDPELERWLEHVRTWYGVCRIRRRR